MTESAAPGPIAAAMIARLTAALQPLRLDLIDESAQHAGHAGHDKRGESHFRLRLQAAAFDGLGRVARQRLVYGILAEEMAGRVHALTLELSGSAE